MRQVKNPVKNNKAIRIVRTRQAYLGKDGLLRHLKAKRFRPAESYPLWTTGKIRWDACLVV